MRYVIAAIFFIVSTTQNILADDFGPRGEVREVRFVAQRLLTHSARESKVDPNNVRLSDVVVVKDGALLSWEIGPNHGIMGLIRQSNRWWDALDFQKAVDGWVDVTAWPFEPGTLYYYMSI